MKKFDFKGGASQKNMVSKGGGVTKKNAFKFSSDSIISVIMQTSVPEGQK